MMVLMHWLHFGYIGGLALCIDIAWYMIIIWLFDEISRLNWNWAHYFSEINTCRLSYTMTGCIYPSSYQVKDVNSLYTVYYYKYFSRVFFLCYWSLIRYVAFYNCYRFIAICENITCLCLDVCLYCLENSQMYLI